MVKKQNEETEPTKAMEPSVTTDSNAGRKRPTLPGHQRLGPTTEQAIGDLLRAYHLELVDEPVPEHLRRLIELLEQQESQEPPPDEVS